MKSPLCIESVDAFPLGKPRKNGRNEIMPKMS
jgi:hypothetical protein